MLTLKGKSKCITPELNKESLLHTWVGIHRYLRHPKSWVRLLSISFDPNYNNIDWTGSLERERSVGMYIVGYLPR